MAAVFLAWPTAQAAPEASLASAILDCAAQQGEAAQLACYNRIAAQLKAAPPAPSAPIVATPPPQIAAQAPPPPPTAAGTESAFGLPAAEASGRLDRITAKVANVSYNFFRVFTVTLDNGQVWRQIEGDGEVARFKNDHTETVTISRGFLNGFNLAIEGGRGKFPVKRIK
ncbi:MAG TPA: hypothetical protein VGC36_03040 [Rhizomicrobium sp.]